MATRTFDVEARMSLLEHLQELRGRLVKASAALLIATTISFAFTGYVIDILAAPVGGRGALQAIDLTEKLGAFMRVALISGVTISMPVIVYQLFAFISPGLLPQEKRLVYTIAPLATLCFILGVAFSYFIMLPAAVPFLVDFLGIRTEPRPSSYIGFVTTIMFWLGIAFETPLIIAFLARLGLLSPQKLVQVRRYAIVGMAVLAALITPTIDPINMLLVLGPLVLLYEVGVILARIMYKPRFPPPVPVDDEQEK